MEMTKMPIRVTDEPYGEDKLERRTHGNSR